MQELAGRLTSLDPEASESLKVIAYFDGLVAAGAGLESLVRAATILSGTAAGARAGGRVTRVDAAGRRTHEDAPPLDGFLTAVLPTDAEGLVWLERAGSPHANDAMVVERLALAAGILLAPRASPEAGALERLIDGAAPLEERAAALRRLRLDGAGPLRVSARPHLPSADATSSGATAGASVIVVTPAGLVRAGIESAAAEVGAGPVGHAVASGPAEIPAAWTDARIALALADHRRPVVAAEDLGAMIVLARTFDASGPRHPDVDALLGLTERSRAMLAELVDAESVRAAATALGMHHSSLQSRHESWTHQLSYDPRSPRGRARYEAARLLAALTLAAT